VPEHTPQGGRRGRSVLLAAGIAAGLLIIAGLGIGYMHAFKGGKAGPARSDFLPTYAAAQLAIHRPADLYDLPVLHRVEARLARPARLTKGVLPFFYPPFFAVIVSPLALLPFGIAFWFWGILNVGSLLAVLAWSVRRLPVVPLARVLVAVAALASIPAFGEIVQGQISAFLALSAAGGVIALGRRRDLLAGILLAGLTVKITYVLPIVLALVVARRWRACAALAGTWLLLTGASSVALGPASEFGYLHTLVSAAQWQGHHVGFSPSVNESLDGFWSLLLPASTARVAWLLCSVALVAWLAILARRHGAEPRVLGLAVVAALLISPHVLIHDFVLLLVPIAYSWRDDGSVPTLAPVAWLAVYAGSVLSVLHPAGIPIQWATLALLALSASLLACLSGSRKPQETSVYPSGAVA